MQFDSPIKLNNILDEVIGSVNNETEYKEILDICAKLNEYDARNALLIYAQNQNTSCLKTFQEWNEVNQKISPSEKGISIVDTYIKSIEKPINITGENGKVTRTYIAENTVAFTTKYLFDIAQTQGEYIPEKPFDFSEVDRKNLFDSLCKISDYKITFSKTDTTKINFENSINLCYNKNDNDTFFDLISGISKLEGKKISDNYSKLMQSSSSYIVAKKMNIEVKDDMFSAINFNNISFEELNESITNAQLVAKEILQKTEIIYKAITKEISHDKDVSKPISLSEKLSQAQKISAKKNEKKEVQINETNRTFKL